MRKWLLGLMFLAGLLAACGGGVSGGGGNSGNPVEPEKTAGVLDTAYLQLYQITEPLALAGVPFLPVPFLSQGVAPLDTASWNCSSVTVSGNTTDADNDGIPVDATYNGGCAWSYSGGGSSVSGSWEFKNVHVKDPNDADPSAGLKASGEIVWTLRVSGSSTYTFTWHFNKHDLVHNGSKWDFSFDGYWRASDGIDTYTVTYNFGGSWTPDDPNRPFEAGTMNASGTFESTGPGCSDSWHLNVTFSGVHDNGTKIDRGTATFSGTDCEGNSATLTVTWSATQVCVTYEGNTFCGAN